jgi:dipeptidyl aminopeptidase/acylaminoacyl peptidase
MTSGSISDGNVIAIMIIAEGKRLANDIGGDFQQKVNAALKRWPVRGKHKFNASSDIAKAVETLPDEKKRAFNEKILITMMEVIRPNLKSTLDMAPTWSPDGKSLAFTRWDATTGYMRLIVVDVLTSKTKTVFESNVIGNVTWTPDSKSLVLSAKRNLAYKGKSDIPGSLWPEVITMPSYPEIWVLDLK